MEQKLISLLRVIADAESQIDNARASLTESSKQAFKLVDTTGRNILSSFEISQFLEKHKIKLEQDEVRMIVQYYDILRKGKLDPESFQKALAPRNKESSANSSKSLEENLVDFFVRELDLIRKTQTLRVQLFEAAQAAKADIFKMLDKEDNGELTQQDLENFLQSQGARLSSSELKAILQRGDRGAKQVITQQDFESYIAPDVSKKKVIAKQPDLTINTIPDIRKPGETQSAKHHRPEFGVQSYSNRPETTVNRGYNDSYNYRNNGPLSVQQLIEKYDVKSSEYKPAEYQHYTPSHQTSSYSPHVLDRNDYSISKPTAYTPSTYTHYESKPYEPSYYPSTYNPPSSSLQNTSSLYPNPATDYHAPSSSAKSYSFYHKDPNQYPSSAYAGERSRSMSKSISHFEAPKRSVSPINDRGYQDYSASNYGYRPETTQRLSASHYPVSSYEKSRYERSPYRSRDYDRHSRSPSPSRYEPRSAYDVSPSRDYSYQPPYSASYKRTEGYGDRTRSLRSSGYHGTASKPYESSGYRPYESSVYSSDALRKSSVVPQNQALRDWGKPLVYSSPVSSHGVGLYDRNQLQQKYNNLSRTMNGW